MKQTNLMAYISALHPTVETAIRNLRDRWPDVTFLALGQTALWDEPTKAVFRVLLDQVWPEASLIAGTHDTDYFAKLASVRVTTDEQYVVLPHDDGRTRGLWSAAGEMSCLFGSEDVSTVAEMRSAANVEIPRAIAGSDDPLGVISQLTAAWGWTGIVHTEANRRIIADIPLVDILPALLNQFDNTTAESLRAVEHARKAESEATIAAIRRFITDFAETRPEASLADLYTELTPFLFSVLQSGTVPRNLSTTATTRFLRFNTQTCDLPRFAFVELFLHPTTRQYAENAYNLAVAGSDIYTLDQFGEGALPFELALPGVGRGTIFLTERRTLLTVDTPRPFVIRSESPIESVATLAKLVEQHIGPNATLLGKAVSLLPMLAAEHCLVFHEGASGYSGRSRALIGHLRRYGVTPPELRPILRLLHATWDALTALGDDVTFTLPPHLAASFGRDALTAEDFGNCWHFGRSNAERDLRAIKEKQSPRRWLMHLAEVQPNPWATAAQEYETARTRLLALRAEAQAIQGRIYTLYAQVRTITAEAIDLERAKGDDFRRRVRPLLDSLVKAPSNGDSSAQIRQQIDDLQAEREIRFTNEIESRRAQVRFARESARVLRQEILAIERGDESVAARQTLRRIEADAEQEKARQVNYALQTLHGLPHTNNRPSAWWLPVVDPSGRWFARMVETAQVYLEPLDDAVA